jgi:carbon storage regulator
MFLTFLRTLSSQRHLCDSAILLNCFLASALDGTEFLVLVLTRNVGELIVISASIRVTVTAIEGGRMRIGIDAPRDISIVRQELLGGLDDQEDIVSISSNPTAKTLWAARHRAASSGRDTPR